MKDKELSVAVERQRKFLNCYKEWAEPEEGDLNVKALEITIDLAQRYLELGGVVEEKVCPRGLLSFVDFGYNEGRQDTLLAFMKRLESLEEVLYSKLKDDDELYYKEEWEEVATAIRKHILGEKNDER